MSAQITQHVDPEKTIRKLRARVDRLEKALAEQPAQQCRTDGRCQYAIDSGAEGMGHCPKGKCVMPAQQEPVGPEPFGYFQYDIRLDAWVQNRVNNKGVAFYIKEKK